MRVVVAMQGLAIDFLNVAQAIMRSPVLLLAYDSPKTSGQFNRIVLMFWAICPDVFPKLYVSFALPHGGVAARSSLRAIAFAPKLRCAPF
jgi:hypothetical protein